VRAHGGDIHIRNMPGTGCVFSIEMPLAIAVDDENASSPRSSLTSSAGGV
jgi:hypothetical protein